MREFSALLDSLVNLPVQLENAKMEKFRICSATAREQLNIWAQFQNQQTALANEAAFRSQALLGLGCTINSLAQQHANLAAILGEVVKSWSPELSTEEQRQRTKMENHLLSQTKTITQASVQIGKQFAHAANWGPSRAPQGYSYTSQPMMQPSPAYAMPATMVMRRYDYPYLQQPSNSPTGHF